jgi:glycine/D-amino acid oxidase-like deaminating enzyme
VAFRDVQKIVSRNAPLLIWTDPQFILWSSEEKELLQDEELQWLLEKLPAGVHTRPEGGSDSDILLMLWEYRLQESEPIWPPPLDEQYPELVLRGLTTMIPGLKVYHQRAPRPILDGGYYTKSRDNRPIIGPLPVGGANVIGALSGYGLMASCAAGELLAAHLLGTPLPAYAPAFSPDRFQDPAYLRLLSEWGETGQL